MTSLHRKNRAFREKLLAEKRKVEESKNIQFSNRRTRQRESDAMSFSAKMLSFLKVFGLLTISKFLAEPFRFFRRETAPENYEPETVFYSLRELENRQIRRAQTCFEAQKKFGANLGGSF